MSRYGVLLVGGNRTHQENYGRAFAADPRCRLVGVADEPDLPPYRDSLNRMLAAELDIPFFADLDEALARHDVQIVSMVADVERRGRVAARCAEAGMHLYLDKPLAGSVADARAIADAVKRGGVRSQMFSTVTTPWARAARGAVLEGRVGRLLGVHADMLIAKGRPGTGPAIRARTERGEPNQYTFVEAKRELFDMGIYPVALIHWLTGRRATRVSAVTGNYFFAEHARLDLDDLGAMTLELEGGLVASASGGRIGWTSHPRGGVSRVILVGSEGTLDFGDTEPHLELYADEPDFRMPRIHPWDPMGMWASTQQEAGVPPKRRWLPLQEANGIAQDIGAFLDAIDRGVESELPAAECVHHIEILMAAYRSATSGAPVEVP
ncbi:MAG: Gfo/Idh/MocA family oxidoreductase [Candidatus Methylomirabilota bacterium]